ncbi:unnamed protein product, partial [Rotaria sordida]
MELIPYCIRDDAIDQNNNNDQECFGTPITFEELKRQNFTGNNLYQWSASIDTINNYEKFCTDNSETSILKNEIYCNCTANCEKEPIEDDIKINNIPFTCYMGLETCYSTLCLHWRQICDGILNCENGEDERYCPELETNECDPDDEYRCTNGMCISKKFLLDFNYDCMDQSDEKEFFYQDEILSCYNSPNIVCEERLCPNSQYACGDGQCLINVHNEFCYNGRREVYGKNMLLRNKNESNLSSLCWNFMVCLWNRAYWFGLDKRACPSACIRSNNKPNNTIWCSQYMKNVCSENFFFQSPSNSLYPLVKYLYYNQTSTDYNWIHPNYLCFNDTICPNIPYDRIRINNLSCIALNELNSFYDMERRFSIFSNCFIRYNELNESQQVRLFYCQKAKKYISLHRLDDGNQDCIYHYDWYNISVDDESRPFSRNILEYLNSSVPCQFNLSSHFKCATTNQCIARSWLDMNRCDDKSERIFVGKCEKSLDIGCTFYRQYQTIPIRYLFQENCDGYKIMQFSIDNQTDETDCDQWSDVYLKQYRYCDGFWNFRDGRDEIDCSNSTDTRLRENIFNCSANEHYCARSNGTGISCLSIDYVGNGIIDCLGATDERRTINACSSDRPYFCVTEERCQAISDICDPYFSSIACRSEVIKFCPWITNYTCTFLEFMCKNRECISESKRCNGIFDCSEGEDEWFCDLKHVYKNKQFSIDTIEQLTYDSISIQTTTIEIPKKSKVNLPKINVMNKQYYLNCNRGIAVIKRTYNNTNKVKCFCPPSYYGNHCQYETERLTLILQMDVQASLVRYEESNRLLKLVAFLLYENTIVYYEEIVYFPLLKQIFYLIYPRIGSYKLVGHWFVRIVAYSVTMFSVELKGTWRFDVPFAFLPVKRLAVHLTLDETKSCDRKLSCGIHGRCRKYLNKFGKDYCECDNGWSGEFCTIKTICSTSFDCIHNGGKCLARSHSDKNPICICSFGRMGIDCHGQFNSCQGIICLNDGQCIPLDQRTIQWTCLCKMNTYGRHCEYRSAQINMIFSKNLYPKKRTLPVVITHFLQLKNDTLSVLFIENRILDKDVPINKEISVLNQEHIHLPNFTLVQIFSTIDHNDYYLAAIINQNNLKNLTTTILPSYRCPYVNDIISENIRQFSFMKKIKYYHHVCKLNAIKCFIDEIHLCFCTKYQIADCLIFQQESNDCPIKYCYNSGKCIRNVYNARWDFGCVCSGCSYGSLCQLKTSQYALSLDALLGRDILVDVTFVNQTILIKLTFAIVLLMIVIGFISNILSIITFSQGKSREFGSGYYLFCLPIVGQISLIILGGRFCYLLITQLNVVNNFYVVKLTCLALEYLLSVCSALFDWLTCCVGIERAVNMIKGTSFDKRLSVIWSKRLIPIIVIGVCTSLLHE